VNFPLAKKLLTARWGTILRGFYEYNVRRRFGVLPPRQMQINVTYRCNARCAMCNIWQMPSRPELGLEDYQRLLQDKLFAGIERLTIAGGEPSLRADLVSLTEVFFNSMPRLGSLTLITNGLAYRRIIEDCHEVLRLCRAREAHLNVSVSLDGVGAIHDEMRNVPGAFEKVERCLIGLQDLQQEGSFWLGVSCVVTRKNLYHLRELQAWCDERNLELGFQLVGFHETYVANIESQSDLDFTDEDRRYLLDFLARLAVVRSPSDFMAYYWDDMWHMYAEGRSRTTPCPFAIDSLVLDAYGDMYYCLSERKIGNCLAPPADAGQLGPCSAIYYSPDNLAFRKALTKSSCLRCNSACFVNVGIKKDLKGYLAFLAGSRWGGGITRK